MKTRYSIIVSVILLRDALVNCRPLLASKRNSLLRIQWSGNLPDNHTIDIWTIDSTAPDGERLFNQTWLSLAIRDPNSTESSIRMVFDQRHRLQHCWLDTDVSDMSISLDGADILTDSRNTFYLEQFSFTSAQEFRVACKEFKLSFGKPTGLVRRARNTNRRHPMIMPGTLWCGKGNAATIERIFGDEIETDMCCRAHDRCFENINSLTSRYGYYNPSPVTISNCECDDEFLGCLENAGTEAATRVGNLYFNIFRVPCFQRRTERICVETDAKGVCNQYEARERIELFRPQRFISPHIHV